MAIFGLEKEVELKVVDKQNQSIVPMFETERSYEELRSYVAGYKWEVTYFHRLVTEDELVTEYDPELDASLQEYSRIDNFVINVEEPLGSTISGGSGIIDLNAVPNPNDVFIAKMMDGKSVIFAITNVTKPDYNNDKVFKVDYINFGEILDTDDARLTTLLKSTVNEYVYNDDYRITKTQPLLTRNEVNERKTLTRLMSTMIETWSQDFISQDTSYHIAYLDGDAVIYDPQMETFIRQVVGINNLHPKLEQVDVEDNTYSILDYIINEDIGKRRVKRYKGYYVNDVYENNPYLTTFNYLQVDDIIVVSDTPTIDKVNNIINSLFPYVEEETYIFRDSLYNNILNGSIDFDAFTKFEQLVIATLSGSTISKDIIMELCDGLVELPDKERFYFTPILVYITKYYIQTFTINFI